MVVRFGWICHAYCLMNNHYHLLIETPRANLSQGMQLLNGTLSQGFNRRHGRVGHVLQGRFKAILVEKESHLLELARYIVLNPVRAGAVSHPREYPWSSYLATAGGAESPEFLTVSWILSHFDKDLVQARTDYRQFVKVGQGYAYLERRERRAPAGNKGIRRPNGITGARTRPRSGDLPATAIR